MTKQELEQKIDELQKQLDELKNVKVDETNMNKKWVPEENEIFYFVSIDLLVENTYFNNWDIDNKLLEIGNCFKIKEEAQFVADKIKYTLMFRKYVEEHSEPIDWENKEQGKWHIYCNCTCIANYIKFDFDFTHKSQGAVYASSKQILEDAIAYVGEDNIKKYVL